MTAARLTRNIREALMKKLITRAFQERQCDFAGRVYDDALKPHLERTTKATLESVTTVKKLIEVEEFAKHYLDNGERKAVLPAIPRAELNSQLGLPPAERVEVLA